ncbi:MAG TPA: DNA mismatch repair protein MutT [Marinilabiliales bacterium]|jgi:ADP-ribose pyrophosphatase YjhB (NUDIX family)|nr:MAG: DNA mismatch repair protein MutT [Bacteroidetes bacterium GWA2_40_14]OFX65689.1 MAG: DNA mismatch repair protein MutT [Bacteroidetes bacterium GWC2_40_13]OFX75942.1 MAG: DNA mismatch repair protein MutT [Bacteroidetes bacterium GWD2_40_43]OFX94445.1 MAG: DNA mismatch repair protein MutT [Bacteroidetes bacterium GWE2_40_63]OFY17139.1 MAG: DNA mismatch repair protein MutT [Bacteroidetes bacterium GWF2_40_13]OFZ28851.1 MAG: DNA mismatch repair protein MutT [Bacteroidetes bacterium RIFOXYC
MLQPYHLQEKHLVSVDNVIFGYHEGQLKLLLFKRNLEPALGQWSLIGGWVNPKESVEDAANRVLVAITGLKDIFMEQVQVFSNPERDPGGRVISVVFYALINIQNHNHQLVYQYNAEWWPVSQLPGLIFDHQQMVNAALEKLRKKASYDLVGRDLLPPEFTITQLRQLYNSIFMKEFDPGNFRKKILSLDTMERLDKKDTSESKKGAYYYRFKPKEAWDFTDRIIKM